MRDAPIKTATTAACPDSAAPNNTNQLLLVIMCACACACAWTICEMFIKHENMFVQSKETRCLFAGLDCAVRERIRGNKTKGGRPTFCSWFCWDCTTIGFGSTLLSMFCKYGSTFSFSISFICKLSPEQSDYRASYRLLQRVTKTNSKEAKKQIISTNMNVRGREDQENTFSSRHFASHCASNIFSAISLCALRRTVIS